MTNIQWTDETWNPVTGCNKVSQGCKNCYAEKMHRRLIHIAPHKYTKPFLDGVEMHAEELNKPLHWKKPRRIFVNSMSDLFHEGVDFYFIEKVFDIMKLCPQHTFQILTKRPERLLKFIDWNWGGEYKTPSNVWIGVSVEDQKTADERIPLLLQVPSSVRFLSCEPLLGRIDLKSYLKNPTYTKLSDGIHWVIVGGESGSKARPVHPFWIRTIGVQCSLASIPFFFKQWGEYIPVRQHDSVPIQSDEWFSDSGHFDYHPTQQEIVDKHLTLVRKLGKSKTGNTLDGHQYMQFPSTCKCTIQDLQPLGECMCQPK